MSASGFSEGQSITRQLPISVSPLGEWKHGRPQPFGRIRSESITKIPSFPLFFIDGVLSGQPQIFGAVGFKLKFLVQKESFTCQTLGHSEAV